MNSAERLDRMIVAIMLDPRAVTQTQRHSEYGIACAFARAVESETDQITLEVHEEPNWSWWEPRYDQPGRREATRYREIVGA